MAKKAFKKNNYQPKRTKNGFPARSGAKYQKYTPSSGADKGVEKWFIYGWKATKGGLLKVKIYEKVKNNPKITTSKTGKTWIPSVMQITNQNTGAKGLHSCLFCEETRKVICDDLGWVINPQAPNGGYIGKFTR